MTHKTADPSSAMAIDKEKAQMFKIFQNVQFNVVQHKKYSKELRKLYKKTDEGKFRDDFSTALRYLFTFGEASPNVDRVILFVATFCTSLDDEDFLIFIFGIIFECQRVADHSVRFRATQLLAAVLTALGEDASLDDDLCDKLLASQLERIQDTRGAVRCRAALALQRLQNPMESDDPVTRAYRFHMSCDPSSSVRRAIVMSIAKSTRNVPFVLERLCDVDEAVRRAAFIYVAAINVTQLKVRQRVHVLKVGLTERSTRVRRVVEEILLPGWLSTFKGNIVDLLTAVRLDNTTGSKDSQYVAGKLLESLFKRLPISELLEWLPIDKMLRVIPAERLGKETAWYWRHLAEHLVKIDDDETLETVLPDLVVLVGYIRAIVESPCPDERTDPVGFNTRQCVLHELACMLRAYDVGDEVGRTALQQLLMDVLTGDYGAMSEETYRALVSALELIVPDVSRRIEFVVSVVEQLREPPEQEAATVAPPPQVECNETKMKRARLRVSLNVAMEAQEEAVREQNYALAAECKEKVENIQRQLETMNVQVVPPPPPPPPQVPREKSSDPDVLNRCLMILNMALDTPQIKTITPLLKMLFTELQEEIFQNPELLENALKTVALYGMLDAEFAKEHKAFFFANLVDLSNERIVCTVLRGVCDLLCVHGLRLLEEDETSRAAASKNNVDLDESDMSLLLAPSHGTVIEVLLKAMDSQFSSYRLIVVVGLCRLMYLGHLESPAILSRLLLLWFSPATEEEDILRQTLGVFFQSFAVSADGAQEQIQKAVLPTLKALANAPAHSPLAEIDQDSIIRFIVSLTRVQQEMSDSGGSTALLLVNYLVAERTQPAAALVCKCLAMLQPPRDPQLATDLAITLRPLLLDLQDKASQRCVSRYLGALESMEKVTLKMSTMATINEESTNNETVGLMGRATSSLSAHPPLARSTHVGVLITEENIEIDETSPEDAVDNHTSKQAQNTPKTSRTGSNNEQTEAREGSDKHAENTPQRRHTDCDKDSFIIQEQRRHSDSDRRVTLVRGSKVAQFESPLLSLSPDVEIPGTQEMDDAPQLSDSSEGSSPRKIPRKGDKITKTAAGKAKSKSAAKQKDSGSSGDDSEKGIKRTRSQRSIVDLNRGSTSPTVSTPVARTKTKGRKAASVETPNSRHEATAPETPSSEPRRSSRTLQSSSSSESTKSQKSSKSSGSTRKEESSSGSSGKSTKAKAKKAPQSAKKGPTAKKKAPSAKKAPPSVKKTRSSLAGTRSSGVRSDEEIVDSADETELHTIVYESELVQSLMADSSDDEANRSAKGNVTIPETPETSERSASSSPDMIRVPARSKGGKNKKL